jgi:hypothetical protein
MLKTSLLLICVLTFVISKSQTSTVYIDGSNNTYTITENKIEYIAVKKENSSSGVYSGGKSESIKITAKQFSKINSLVVELEKDSTCYLSDRLMGCGTLKNERIKTPLYIAMNSVKKNELESCLKQLLGL